MSGGYDQKKIMEILQRQRLGVLATTGESGPRTALVAFAFIEDQKRIFFFTPRNTSKYRNILSEPRVSLLVDDRCVHSKSEDITAVMATGRCRECPSDMRQVNKELLRTKMNAVPDGQEQALMFIEVDRIDAVATSQSLSSIVL